PTQPFPLKPPPFARQNIAEADLTDSSPEAHAEALHRFRAYRGGAAFTPPSTNGSLVVPGFHGGATWSGASVDPTTGILYVNSNEQPNIARLVEQERRAPALREGSGGAEPPGAAASLPVSSEHPDPAGK